MTIHSFAHELIAFLLPQLAIAGRYTAEIQRRVRAHESKPGSTPFEQALSDADLSVQGFLEVALLSKFPEISFFSEEQAQSLNLKYFAPTARFEVLLDPVDGTRFYLDNREGYQIIVSLLDGEDVVAAVLYMPRRHRFYFAIKGEGAYLLNDSSAFNRAQWQPLRLTQSDGPVLLYNAADLTARIRSRFEAIDVVEQYQQKNGEAKFTDLLEGRAIATLHAPVQLIDNGAIAFIAEEAGAMISDFSGKPLTSFRKSPTRVLPNLMIATNATLHAALVELCGQ